MRTDLQKAALQKLARLTQPDNYLSPHRQDALHDCIIRPSADKNKLSNGVNGLNGGITNSPGHVLVVLTAIRLVLTL